MYLCFTVNNALLTSAVIWIGKQGHTRDWKGQIIIINYPHRALKQHVCVVKPLAFYFGADINRLEQPRCLRESRLFFFLESQILFFSKNRPKNNLINIILAFTAEYARHEKIFRARAVFLSGALSLSFFFFISPSLLLIIITSKIHVERWRASTSARQLLHPAHASCVDQAYPVTLT